MNIHERKFDPIPIEEIDAAKTGTESVDAASLPVPTIPPDDAPSPDWMRLFGRARSAEAAGAGRSWITRRSSRTLSRWSRRACRLRCRRR